MLEIFTQFSQYIQHEYFWIGILYGLIIIPFLLFLIIWLLLLLSNLSDYYENKEEFEEWLKRKEMKD